MNSFEKVSRKEYEDLKKRKDIQIIFIVGEKVSLAKEIFDIFHEQTGAEYMGRTWDSLDEVLHDCDWMKCDRIFIIHDGMPKFSQEDEDIYERILETAVKIHEDGPRKDFILPQRKIDFHVALIEG